MKPLKVIGMNCLNLSRFMLIKKERENTKEGPIILCLINITSLFKPRMSHYICNILYFKTLALRILNKKKGQKEIIAYQKRMFIIKKKSFIPFLTHFQWL